MSYLPIENYGIIGNMRSVALVGTNGSIDWFCFPNFDSPSIFASILDENKGGNFKISPVTEEHKSKQFYWPDTNVLVTRFTVKDAIVEITDFMPVGKDIIHEEDYRIIRRIKGVHGKIKMKVECTPGFNYARDSHTIDITREGAIFHSRHLSMGLASTIPLSKRNNTVYKEFEIKAQDSVVFVFHKVSEKQNSLTFSREKADERFVKTVQFWRNWLSHSNYQGRWWEMVNRSALILKLLTFEPTGAIVAAPTCSLPEEIGGERNWDYRYTWIRDAAFTVYAFMRIGFTEEAAKFMTWIVDRCNESNEKGKLQVMYAIDGGRKLTEEYLDHLEGYRKSSPVRIGNGAYNQLQLDIYGELMDSAYLFNKYGTPISFSAWKAFSESIEWVCDNWAKKDNSIWEVRSGKQHFVYSKLMCWVALDRAIRLSMKRSLPADLAKWEKVRDAIYMDVMNKGWNEEIKSFVQYYGSKTLDASNLIMPLIYFLSPSDPLMLNTLDSIMKSPDEGGLVTNSLVFRYNDIESPDGFSGREGTFNICTFWLVEALTRAGRNDPSKLDRARLIFEQILGYANHLGIYSEEIGLGGEALGNTPQAFTHLALISSAYNLNKALNHTK